MRLLSCLVVASASILYTEGAKVPRGSRGRRTKTVKLRPRGLQSIVDGNGLVLDSMETLSTGMDSRPGGGGGGGSSNGGASSNGGCKSLVASAISQAVPEAITMNPDRCCDFDGPTAVYVTHAQADPSTVTGFEVFWNSMYLEIADTSEMYETCFVMTGYNQEAMNSKSLGDILVEVNTVAASVASVPAMMSTDPTEDAQLTNLFRTIASTPDAPSIGVFNAGFANLATEAIISGQGRIPYIGYTDDSLYGTEAAAITLKLLDGVPATPICFNARPELIYIGRRCAAYYQGVSDNPPSRLFGVACTSDSSVASILALLLEQKVNAVYTHVDCCQVVGEAVEMARNTTNTTIILGCQDDDTAGNTVNFVTKQPMQLQAYSATSFVNLPVTESVEGRDGEAPELFPSLQTLLHTEIFSQVIF